MAELRVAAAVLAAGQSRRFGMADKLAAELNGRRLAEYATGTLAGLPLAQRWVIAGQDAHPCAAAWQASGFAVAVNGRAGEGMGTSLALAARLAAEAGADALLVALADMPLVPASHFAALLERGAALGEAAVVASAAAGQRSPPALFGRAHFAELAEATGDQGARHLLAQADLVTCAPDWLVDVDDPAALAAVAARLVAPPESC